jgi:CheY-like chemotaxis protein
LKGTQTSTGGTIVKALIVEDNELMRRLIKGLIGGLVDVVIECGSGEAACEVYAVNRPDWVLMDIQLPGLDGITAAGRIKAAFPPARILIVTEHGDESLRQAAREAGACGYVLKENLLAIRELIRQSPTTKETPQ